METNLYYYEPLNKYVAQGAAWENEDGVQYLIGWDTGLSEQDIAALGLQKVIDTNEPEQDLEKYMVFYELSGATRTWINTLRPVDPESEKAKIKAKLQYSDAGLRRDVEDLYDFLVSENVVIANKIPEPAKSRLAEKKALRQQLKDLEDGE